ncbi:3-hydroxyacyl-CoA dehydrogenase family protein [Kitasatospora sp. NPDC018058]|uniref:3-hydroxyacyl-CoA dehydrogenase family protein n=1 Tax=Kitasatospora sp. NPDC018058 TaxID=3364025 RepID=UPI0037C00363
MAVTPRTIGVVGAGSIGASVCADLVLHGFHVVLVDTVPTQLDRAREVLTEAVRFGPMVRPGLPRLDLADALAAVRFTTELEDLTGCEFVVENVSEHWETKRELYRRLDALLPAEVGFGVNTSSIPVGRVAAETSRPDRVIGIHFMNPAYLKEAVEVMRGDATSQECLDDVLALLSGMGKETIVVGDFPGFVSNRISHLFFNEASRVVEDHGVEPAVVDEVFRKCFGHLMGPLETADLIGLDTVLLTLESLHDSYGDDRFLGSALLRDKVASGRLGRKTGEGFYTYRPTP